MRAVVFAISLLFLLPGCIDSQNSIFNGKDLNDLETYKFTLSDQNQSSVSLEDHEGKVVVLAFIYTRCDDVCLIISSNLKYVKSQLTSDELEQISFISVTIDWKHDSPEVLKNWSTDMGFDWPHLTDWNSGEIKATYSAYDIVPYDEEEYQVLHLQPVYILDSNLKGQVMWSEFDWPVDLFIEDLRTVLALQ
jgi:protein SCO1/2